MKKDMIKIVATIALLFGSGFSFYYFKENDFLLAIGGMFFLFLAGFITLMTTELFKNLQDRLGQIKHELMLIIWPKGNEAFKSFTVVVIFSIIFAGIIWGLDTQLSAIYKEIILD